MTTQIRIEGDLVTVVEESIISTAQLADVIPFLARPSDTLFMGLPNGIHSIYSDGGEDSAVLIVQQMPNTRVINYHGTRTGTPRQFRLAFPWIYWLFNIRKSTQPGNPNVSMSLNDYRVLCSGTPLTRPDQSLIALPLHNVYADGRICFGTAAAEMGQTFGQHLDTVINNFWMSNFNNDIAPRLPMSYIEWERASVDNPHVWQEWNWETGWGSQMYPLSSLVGANVNRTIPIVPADPIPPLPMGATFGRIQEWIDELRPGQRNRLLAVVNQTQPADEGPDEDAPF